MQIQTENHTAYCCLLWRGTFCVFASWNAAQAGSADRGACRNPIVPLPLYLSQQGWKDQRCHVILPQWQLPRLCAYKFEFCKLNPFIYTCISLECAMQNNIILVSEELNKKCRHQHCRIRDKKMYIFSLFWATWRWLGVSSIPEMHRQSIMYVLWMFKSTCAALNSIKTWQ